MDNADLSRIMVRPEFDIEYLALDERGVSRSSNECINAYKRYTRLIFNTHNHIVAKLGESSPANVNGSFLFKLVGPLRVSSVLISFPGNLSRLFENPCGVLIQTARGGSGHHPSPLLQHGAPLL